MTHVRHAKIQDVGALASNLRDADRREIEAFSSQPPLVEILRPFFSPGEVYAIETDQVIALFGVGPSQQDQSVGVPWLLGTEAFPKCCLRDLSMQGPYWLKYLMRNYQALENHVYAANDVHVRWIKRLGFRVVGTSYLGHRRERFLRFRLNQRELQ